MKKGSKQFLDIGIRYLILILLAVPGLGIFYYIFTPLTVYLSYSLFEIFFDVSLRGNLITINYLTIEIISACVAGSAYYLLTIFNLATPKIKIKKRINILLVAFATLLIINVLRIFFLGLLSLSGSEWFDVAHKFFWYFLSSIFVVAIWFAEVKFFKIKEIPGYSDLKFLYKKSILGKK